MSFRTDDVYYLEWAATHGFADAWVPSRAALFGVFRPVQNTAWLVQYRLFGLDPAGYQVVLTATYLFALGLFGEVARLLQGGRVALVVIGAYFAQFYFLTYIVFWFSDQTFVLELLLMNTALLFLIGGIRRAEQGRRADGHVWAGLVVGVAAFLSKEPSALIVPAVTVLALRSAWERIAPAQRRRLAGYAALLVVLGGLWLLNPFAIERQGIPVESALDAAAFAWTRWTFYAGFLAQKLGVALWVGAFGLLLESAPARFRRGAAYYAWMGLAVAASVALTRAPGVGLGVLAAVLAVVAWRRPAEAPAAAWLGLPVLGLTTISFVTRTYLTEASFGAALITGAGLYCVGRRVAADARARGPWTRGARLAAGGAAAAAALVGLAGAGLLFGSKVEALQTVSEVRLHHERVLEAALDRAGSEGLPLVIVGYEEMGIGQDALTVMGDLEKARTAKTMEAKHVEVFARLSRPETPAVVGAGAFAEREHGGALAVVGSERERAYLLELWPEAEQELVSAGPRAAAYLFRIRAHR